MAAAYRREDRDQAKERAASPMVLPAGTPSRAQHKRD
jgi:hypothetical protein